jgi:carbamoyl-phosphate synthase small subunit
VVWDEGYGEAGEPRFKVVAMDFGAKRNILRLFGRAGLQVTVVPATTSAEDILAMNPDGVFLSNGPGDPAATGEYAVPEISKLVPAASRCSASASATRCWRWRLAARP